MNQTSHEGKIIFIHGAFCGTTYSNFRDPLSEDGGFQTLNSYFKSGQAKLYYWAKDERKFKWFQLLNPFYYLQTYLIDRSYAQDSFSLSQLDDLMCQTQPTKIIVHSLGSRKLSNYLKQYKLPHSVREIYILAGELSQKEFELSSELIDRIISGELTIYNYYCPWDQALIFASIYHLSQSMGLAKTKSKYIQDVFYPLKLKGNPHNYHFKDPNLASKILS